MKIFNMRSIWVGGYERASASIVFLRVRRACRARRHSPERGSVLVVTLLSFAALVGAFIYIAVIAKKADTSQHLHPAAGSAAMAAATIKARTLNYAAYLLMADAVLLPLGQVSHNIVDAQETFLTVHCAPCFFAGSSCPIFEKCEQYVELAKKTRRQQPGVDALVDTWLDAIEEMAGNLDTVGPLWAELEAVATGEMPAGPGSCAARVAVFPLPDSGATCGRLGIELVDNQVQDDGQSACHAQKELEQVYLFALKDPALGSFNEVGMGEIFKLLIEGAGCDKRQLVPRLSDDWWRYRISRGFALCEYPSDPSTLGYMQALSKESVRPTLKTGWQLGKACAEHYSQEHYEHPSLWHMDWRARKVPCDFDTASDDQNHSVSGVEQVLACGGVSAPAAAQIQQQFANEQSLNITSHWKY